jgi:glycosyltransferase involved in cell wall biosynthesis
MVNPTVSILTPTYCRREYLPLLIEFVKAQNYDLKKCEWVILDDSPESNADLFVDLVNSKTIKVRYCHYVDGRLTIGSKRNMLNELAEGEIMIAFDDDDYHTPDRVGHTVAMLNKFKAEFAGNSELYMYFTDDDTIWKYDGQHGPNHFTNGTAAYRRSYISEHRYDPEARQAEESSFSNSYEKPIVQLNPLKSILVKCHPGNTVDKRFMRIFNPVMKSTPLKLRDFIKDPRLRETFKQLGRFNGEPIRLPRSVVNNLAKSGQLQQMIDGGALSQQAVPA